MTRQRKSAAIEVYENDNGEIVVKWHAFGTDDAFVCFPAEQAEQVCKWIMEVKNEIVPESDTSQEPVVSRRSIRAGNGKKTIEVNTSAPTCPTTVGELIDNLALHPCDWEVSFSPFTLYRTKDRGGLVHFEFNEIEGNDYTLHEKEEG